MSGFSYQDLMLILLMGVTATAVLDLWALSANRAFKWPVTDWALVGRWFSFLPRGRFRHAPISSTSSVTGEAFIGWVGHYLIGVLYALLYMVVLNWLAELPSLGSALLFGVITIFAPWLILQPGLGLGFFASATANPPVTRVINLTAHTIFGFGLYLGWLVLAPIV